MKQKETLKQQYDNLEWSGPIDDESVIQADSLLTFPYEYPGSDTEVSMDTDEFTAVCPWTGLPDFGTLVITYVPRDVCLELKSVKYYLLGYRNVGIVQEHAANRILNDLAAACEPHSMTLTLDYNTRGGLHTVVTAHHPKS
ncbi:MAG: preQ(1) synthase [Chloroflexota bacterium]|nr:preQ(1) synthase [Chloroflexota bacterium]